MKCKDRLCEWLTNHTEVAGKQRIREGDKAIAELYIVVPKSRQLL